MNPLMYIKEGIMVALLVVIIGMAFRITYLGKEVAEEQMKRNQAENQVSLMTTSIHNQNRMIDQMREKEAQQAADLVKAQTNANTKLVAAKRDIEALMQQKAPVGCEDAIGWLVEEAQK